MAFYSHDGSVIYTESELERHHPWCNRHNLPRQGCTMCDKFYIKYPPCQNMENAYFPSAEVIKSGFWNE